MGKESANLPMGRESSQDSYVGGTRYGLADRGVSTVSTGESENAWGRNFMRRESSGVGILNIRAVNNSVRANDGMEWLSKLAVADRTPTSIR